MNFLPRDICEKLVEKNCKSESFFYWVHNQENPCTQCEIEILEDFHAEQFMIQAPAFIFQDFCGISERAIENCKILWPKIYCWRCKSDYLEGRICQGSNFSLQCAKTFEWEVVRRESLKKAWDEWVDFMRNAIK